MARSLCRKCGVLFVGLVAFDNHQTQDFDSGSVTCKSPKELGYIERDGGVYGPPVPENLKIASGEVAPLERVCVSCGRSFMRPKRRGRPPTKCPDCR